MNAPPEMRRAPGKAPLRNCGITTSAHPTTADAERLNQAHERAYGASWDALEACKQVGEMLNALMPSDAWIDANCVFKARMGRYYKQLAENWPLVEAARRGNALPEASLRSALRLIAEAKTQRNPLPAPKSTESADKPKAQAVAKLEARLEELEQERENLVEAAALARELDDELSAYKNTEPDEQQKEIRRLQIELQKMEADRDYWKRRYYDENRKVVEAIRQVKRQQKALARLGTPSLEEAAPA